MIELWANYGRLTYEPSSIPLSLGAERGVALLREKQFSLSIVTARSNQESWKVERTHGWVQKHFPFISSEDIHFVNHYATESQPKSVICTNLGISLMIDDSIENAIDLCEHNISCILLDKPWNRHIRFEHPLFYRAEGWNDIIHSLTLT
jgi:5'(3')-deoxyribonucleotidase